MIYNNSENIIEIIVKDNGFTRIDKYLSEQIDGCTRTKIAELINSGNVTVNGRKTEKNYKVKCGDEVVFCVPEPVEYDVIAENIPVDIVFEDEHLLVVNKPKGMVVHPAHGNPNATLVNALMYHCQGNLSGINGVLRPGIVHRIDKDTSGLLVVAKSDIAHNALALQFKDHSIEREYRAIVFGNLKDDSGTIDKPIGRHPFDRKKMSCNAKQSKIAITHYEVIEHLNGFDYIKCKLETGRTHQIRVHMSQLGHFIIGDLIYGQKLSKIKLDFEGQCLHAKTLGFNHPVTGEFMRFDSELPGYFSDVLLKLSKI